MRLTLALFALLLAWGAVGAADAPPPDLTAALDSYRGLAPASAGLPADGRELTVGSLKLTFGSGSLVPLRGRLGEVLGIVFEGAGDYAYSGSSDPQSFALNLSTCLTP